MLLTRLNAVHEAAMVDVFCVDKTGTLTSNQLRVAAVTALTEEFKEADVLAPCGACQLCSPDSIP